jgi:hypothetical protein
MAEQDRQRILEALQSQLLEHHPDPTKAPVNFDAKLDDVDPSKPDSAARVFLKAGYHAWYAYFLATEKDPSLIPAIDALAPEAVKHVASETQKTCPQQSIQLLDQHLFSSSARSAKRRRR